MREALLHLEREGLVRSDQRRGFSVEPISAREEQVLGLILRGSRNREIAERLGISENTVKYHIASVYAKLGVVNRAEAVREAYLTRWGASETPFGEDKTPMAGAGNRTSGPVLRSGSPRLVIQEAWAWLTATQLTRAGEAAALRGEAAAARALRRKDAAPVTADEESFTAARHHMIRSMTTSQVTASSSLDALAAAADSAARAVLHTLNLPGRQRHSERAQKARPKFLHATATKPTVTAKPQVTVFAPGFP